MYKIKTKAIWRVRKSWFATKIPEYEILRLGIGNYLDSNQLVQFLKENEL